MYLPVWLVSILSLNPLGFPAQDPPPPPAGLAVESIAWAAVGPGVQLSFDELEDVLLHRLALAQSGRGALRQLIDLAVLEHLAQARDVRITPIELNERWSQIEKEIVQSGQAGSIEEFLEASGIDRVTFRRYLELALVQEVLTRLALGLDAKAAVNAEQQKLWIDSEIETLGYLEHPHFWEGGVVAEIGPVRILRADFARHLREQTDPKEIRQACYEALLLKKIRQRMPDLSAEAEAKVVEEEIDTRRKSMEQDPRYKGLKYEQILATQGLNLDILKKDPAVVAAALARLWVDRTCDDECLRGAYQSEREQFDGLFGDGAQVFAIKYNAGEVKNELITRTYADAEADLEAMRKDLVDLETFQRVATVRTEDIRAREAGGLIGWVRGRTPGIDPAVRNAVMEAIAAMPAPVSGTLLGPIRLQGSVVMLCLGERAFSPTWEVMAQNVHRELLRRFMIAELPTGALHTYLEGTQHADR